MVLNSKNVNSITDYILSSESERKEKYLSAKNAKKAKVVVLEGKNVELVEELLDLQDQIKREHGKILDLEQQIKDHKGLTDLQYYQQYVRGCAADNYINEHEKKGIEIQRKRNSLSDCWSSLKSWRFRRQ